ncbi:MAG: YhcH/YjgK/YiaL family protein [Treponema sp.]|jgi:YhcH/YjgK/YiaL family protein|nr:YhcH/YjgK/YiaL family protein [Treponema sp.]
MFASNILFVEKYDYLNSDFRLAYDFLRRGDLADIPVGTIKLSKSVTVKVQEYTTKPPSESKFETHDRMFDIQFLAAGQEMFGIAPRDSLEAMSPYDNEKDVTFYRDPPIYGSVLLQAGEFIVVSPEDAHKPACIAGSAMPVKKIVVKICV